MHYTIDNITALIGARRFGSAEACIDWLLTDSRSLDTTTYPNYTAAAYATLL